MHSTDNLNDGYFGSGKRLWFSLKYHGKENHTKEILEFLPTREALKVREKEIVTKELIGENLCMNLKEGGDGGFMNEEHMLKCSKAGNLAFKEKLKFDEEFRRNWSEKYSKLMKKTKAEYKAIGKYIGCDWNGKHHSVETKKLMSRVKKGTGIGKQKSQYGTCWVTKNGTNKKIKKEDLEIFLIEGWVKGRK
jgi:hypothetical protein